MLLSECLFIYICSTCLLVSSCCNNLKLKLLLHLFYPTFFLFQFLFKVGLINFFHFASNSKLLWRGSCTFLGIKSSSYIRGIRLLLVMLQTVCCLEGDHAHFLEWILHYFRGIRLLLSHVSSCILPWKGSCIFLGWVLHSFRGIRLFLSHASNLLWEYNHIQHDFVYLFIYLLINFLKVFFSTSEVCRWYRNIESKKETTKK